MYVTSVFFEGREHDPTEQDCGARIRMPYFLSKAIPYPRQACKLMFVGMFAHMNMTSCPLSTSWTTGAVTGAGVVRTQRTIGDLVGLFADEAARAKLPQDRLAYATECAFPVAEGTVGGLFWGTTFIEPLLVGDEYLMTKGHFHARSDRTEFYFTYAGEGVLLLMDRSRRCWAERMVPGSTHAIPPDTAHRTINVGQSLLSFGACWPSDAGHDYAAIARDGFSARVVRRNGAPMLVPA